MKHFRAVSIWVIVLALAGCGGSNDPGASASNSDSAKPAASGPRPTAATEATVPFKVEGTNVTPSLAQADIRLEGYATEDDLKEIAVQLRDSQFASSSRVFIAFYLPDMVVDAGAWAMAKFDPQLSVEILGMPDTASTAELAIQGSDTSEVIGTWVDNRPYVGNTTTFYVENGKAFVETVYLDGSKSKNELKETTVAGSKRFDTVPPSRHGDYWVLLESGKLEVRDSEGLIALLPRVD